MRIMAGGFEGQQRVKYAVVSGTAAHDSWAPPSALVGMGVRVMRLGELVIAAQTAL